MFIRQQCAISSFSLSLSLYISPLLGIRKFHEQLLQFNFISISPLPLPGIRSGPRPPSPRLSSSFGIIYCAINEKKNKKKEINTTRLAKLCISLATKYSPLASSTILLQNFIINGCRLSAHWIQLKSNTHTHSSGGNKNYTIVYFHSWQLKIALYNIFHAFSLDSTLSKPANRNNRAQVICLA